MRRRACGRERDSTPRGAGPGRTLGAGGRRAGQAAVRRSRRAGGSGARAWREGGRAGGPPPRALVGRRFALSRHEIETRALGIAAPALNLLRPGPRRIPAPRLAAGAGARPVAPGRTVSTRPSRLTPACPLILTDGRILEKELLGRGEGAFSPTSKGSAERSQIGDDFQVEAVKTDRAAVNGRKKPKTPGDGAVRKERQPHSMPSVAIFQGTRIQAHWEQWSPLMPGRPASCQCSTLCFVGSVVLGRCRPILGS